MRAFEYPRSPTLPVAVQAAFAVLCGLALAWLVISVPMPILVVGFVAMGYCIVFLQRPDLGLLVILAVRPSTDITLWLMDLSSRVGPLAVLTPNAALILVLLGCGAAYMLVRGVPFLSLPGGVLLVLLQLAGLVAMLRSPSILSALNGWLGVASGVIVYALAAHLFRTPQQMQRVIDVLAVSFVTPAIFGFQQFAQGMYRVRGPFVTAPGFSMFLVLILIIFLDQFLVHSGRRKFLALVIAATSGILLILTLTRGAWIAALAGVFAIAILRKRVLLVLALIAIMFAAPMNPSIAARLADPFGEQHSSLADRLDLWQFTIQAWATTTSETGGGFATIVDRLVGFGPRGQALLTGRTAYGDPNVAHDDYLRVLIDYGIFGLIVYLLLTLVVAVFAYRTWRRCTDKRLGAVAMSVVTLTIAYAVFSLTDNFFGVTYVSIPLWTLAGMTVAIARQRAQREDQRLTA